MAWGGGGENSGDWCGSVWLGEFGYEAAIPELVESLDAASMNLGGAAYESLLKLVPGPHPELPGPGAATEYFTKLLAERAEPRASGVR